MKTTTTKRTATVQATETKRLIAHLDNDGASTEYSVQVRIGKRWTDVGHKMPAERSECDGLMHAWRVYSGVAA